MRLIDADELLNKKYLDEFAEGVVSCEDIINAPTVETYTKDDMTREYLKGYNACKDMNERPQGEWIIIDKYSDDYKCSVCNSYPLERGDYPELSKFCPTCGAKMKIQE